MTKAKIDNKNLDKSLIQLSADAMRSNGKEALAKEIENKHSFTEVANMFATNGLGNNTLAGDLAFFVAKQIVEGVGYEDIFGDLFREGEDIDVGAGFQYITDSGNNLGISNQVNYQTSTDATGAIAFGSSFSNADFMSAMVTGSAVSQIENFPVANWATLNLTIPQTWASFSALSPQKASEIIDLYETRLKNQKMLYFYALGNTLFTYFIKNNYFANVLFCNKAGVANAKTNGYTYTPPQNLIQVLQHELLPLIKDMGRLHYAYNLGFALQSPPVSSWGFNSVPNYINHLETSYAQNSNSFIVQGLPYVTYNNAIPRLQAVTADKLIILMNVKVATSLLTLLQSNYLTGNVKKELGFEVKDEQITKVCGVEVKIVGTNINLPVLTPQGTAQGNGTIGNEFLDDNTIIVMDKDALLFHKFYDVVNKSGTLVNAMVELVREHIAYLPFLNPWKNGVILKFDDGVLTATNYLTVKTIS